MPRLTCPGAPLSVLSLAAGLLSAATPALAQSAAAPAGAPAGAPGAAFRPAGPPPPQGWTMSVGVGTLVGTAWQGSRDTALSVIPDLRINYRDRIFLSIPEGLGWNAINRDGWRIGPVLKPRFGRNEDNGGSPFQIVGGSNALRGMGDIGVAGELGGFVEKRLGRTGQWRGRIEVRQGFGAHEGVVGDLSLTYGGRAGRVLYSVGPRATLASRDFMQTYFGVNAAQAARTGLAVSRPDGGLVSWGLGGNLIRPLDRRRAVSLFAGIDRLGDAPAGSALIRQRGQRTSYAAGLLYSFRFGL
ncbi:MipA/OmpV family protein [Novosphingobium piscinae]|uniref:MipA/OmpV family protein n=1 Tax=Novosphingobium piscinae TaxID=1507448 RepID=A0A7X1G0Q2_9SPHN|nr:MipA/OmpV family protein [Novosphingobium piscinae]MBC2670520.1 MipA/OmpV family protein [Novosphingobium piscinae]